MSRTPLDMLALLSDRQRRGARALFGLMLIGMALETLGLGLVIPIVALLTSGDLGERYPIVAALIERAGPASQRGRVIAGMLGLAGVYLVKNVFLTYLTWRQARFTFDIETDLSQRLFTTYLRQPWTFHLQRNSAGLFHNISNEVGLFTGSVSNAILLLAESLVMVGVVGLLLAVDPVGALLVVAVLGSAGWAFHGATRGRMTRWGLLRQRHAERSVQHLMQGLHGAKDVKLLGREGEFIEQFGQHHRAAAHIGQLRQTLQAMPRLGLELLMIAGLTTLVLSMVARDRDFADVVPTLAVFAAAAFRLLPSLNRVLGAVQSLRYDLPVLDTLEAELALEVPPVAPRAASVAPVLLQGIEVEHVDYTYPGAARPALVDVSLHIAVGEAVGLIGPSGSGKSTLVDVILGLLTADRGTIRVDGTDISRDLRAWQNRVGYVPQSIYLTDDSLFRNVAFGLADEDIDAAAVERAVRAAQLESFVATLPDGLHTIVGERGVRLSGGQRQRIGIARALYHDPPVLVLDEATSSLDGAVEKDVMAAVSLLQGEKTLLIVAHRLTTVANCDRLYRVEQGRIVAEGAPAEILRLVAPGPIAFE